MLKAGLEIGDVCISFQISIDTVYLPAGFILLYVDILNNSDVFELITVTVGNVILYSTANAVPS